MGIVGLMKTAAPVTIAFKHAGRAVMLLGGLGSATRPRFGGTQYAKAVLKQLWGLPPALDMEYEKRVQTAVREIVEAGLAESAHDSSDGGLAVALAGMRFGPAGVGAELDLESDLRPELLLFHEGPSRILISTAQPEAVRSHRAEARRGRAAHRRYHGGRLDIRNQGAVLVDRDIGRLRRRSGRARSKTMLQA